jgi:hypothetical protein
MDCGQDAPFRHLLPLDHPNRQAGRRWRREAYGTNIRPLCGARAHPTSSEEWCGFTLAHRMKTAPSRESADLFSRLCQLLTVQPWEKHLPLPTSDSSPTQRKDWFTLFWKLPPKPVTKREDWRQPPDRPGFKYWLCGFQTVTLPCLDLSWDLLISRIRLHTFCFPLPVTQCGSLTSPTKGASLCLRERLCL